MVSPSFAPATVAVSVGSASPYAFCWPASTVTVTAFFVISNVPFSTVTS